MSTTKIDRVDTPTKQTAPIVSRVVVILENAPDCELDRAEINIPEGLDSWETSHLIEDAVSAWTLSVGDTIKIREVSP